MKKILFVVSFIPFLLLFTIAESEEYYFSKYISPEGIIFTSYDEHWDEDKLRALYFLLKKHKHGKEINELSGVDVRPGPVMVNGVDGAATYKPSKKLITLYHADKKHFPSEYRHILAHEYGHHVAYETIKDQKEKKSLWASARKLEHFPVQWETTKKRVHAWEPEEILAEDYALLYGNFQELNIEEKMKKNQKKFQTDNLLWNDLLYTIYHENMLLPYAGSIPEYVTYLEKTTGMMIDDERKIKTPKLLQAKKIQYAPTFLFDVDEKEHLLYQVEIHWADTTKYPQGFIGKMHFVTTSKNRQLNIDLNDYIIDPTSHYGPSKIPFGTMVVFIKVVNPKTNTSFFASPSFFRIDFRQIEQITLEEAERDFSAMKFSGYLSKYFSDFSQ